VTVNNDQRADHGHNSSQSSDENESQRLCSGSAGPCTFCSFCEAQTFQGFPGRVLFLPEIEGLVVHSLGSGIGAAVLGLGPRADNGEGVLSAELRHGSREVDFRILNG